MTKNKQSILIANVKLLNIGFSYKFIVNSERRGGGGGAIQYYLITNHFYQIFFH